MQTYEIQVRLKGSVAKVLITAIDANQARELAAAQYGKENIIAVMLPVRKGI